MNTFENQNSHHPSLDNLRSLVWIRSIALLGQTLVLAYVLWSSRTTESLTGLTIALLVMAAFTLLSLWRSTRPSPVADREFTLQLLGDVLGWSVLMYFSGGANNPFVSYLIVPLVIAAAVLDTRRAWLITAACLVAYSGLLYFYLPFPLFTPHAGMNHGGTGNIHVLGMWFNFLFSAGLITYFVIRMAALLRRQQARVTEQKEDRLRDEQIMAVAGLAAGTAHELGTPLGTMTLLIEELQQDDSLSKQAREDCKLLQQQLQRCRQTLIDLSATARLDSTEQRQPYPLCDYLEQVLAHWAVRRPKARYDFQCRGDLPPTIEVDATLSQAIENLLNNAADTESGELEIRLSWDSTDVILSIRDHGPGLSQALLEKAGKPAMLNSSRGMGLGLLLSHATVERYGGNIELVNAAGGGTLAVLTLPRKKLEPADG